MGAARPHFDLIFHNLQRNITLPRPSALARPPLTYWRRTRSRPLSESPNRPYHVTETVSGPSVALSNGLTPSSGAQACGNMGATPKIRNPGIACSTNWGLETRISNIVAILQATNVFMFHLTPKGRCSLQRHLLRYKSRSWGWSRLPISCSLQRQNLQSQSQSWEWSRLPMSCSL